IPTEGAFDFHQGLLPELTVQRVEKRGGDLQGAAGGFEAGHAVHVQVAQDQVYDHGFRDPEIRQPGRHSGPKRRAAWGRLVGSINGAAAVATGGLDHYWHSSWLLRWLAISLARRSD